MYLVAIINLHRGYVLNWPVSNTTELSCCAKILQKAIEIQGRPKIDSTNQESQFTSDVFTHTAFSTGIKLSIDGK